MCVLWFWRKRIQETNSWWIGPKPNKYWKLEKKSESKGWILEESWIKSMDDVNSWRSWWVSIVLGRSWRKEEERKSFEHLGDFQKLTDWTSREYLGLIVFLKEELEEVSFMKLVVDLKSLNFIYGLAQK